VVFSAPKEEEMAKRTCWRTSALFLGIVLLASGLAADVVTVNAVSSGNWSNPSTWSPAVVPNNSAGTAYDVNVSASFFPTLFVPRVAVDISPTINSVTITSSGAGASGTSVEVQNNSTLTAGAISVQAGPGSVAGVTVDSGGTLKTNSVFLTGDSAGLDVSGTAAIGSVDTEFNGGLGVESGGLANVGTLSGGASGNFVSSGGTLNVASSSLAFLSMGVFGTLTVGTGNLRPLTSQNTLVNNGQVAVSGPYLWVGSPSVPCECVFVADNGIYGEVIDSATSFGTISASSVPLDLNGTLDITLANSYVPAVGQGFVIMSGSGPLSGTFANIEGQTFNNGKEKWGVQYTSSDVTLVAEPNVVPEPSLIVLTGFGLAGIVAWSRSRRRFRPNAPAPTLRLS
jgi:hypothetical protein